MNILLSLYNWEHMGWKLGEGESRHHFLFKGEKLFFHQMRSFKIEASFGGWRKYDYDVVDLTPVVQQTYLSKQ